MSHMHDYYEPEPTEFEELMKDFRESLMDSVAEEHKKRLEIAEKNNRLYQERLANLDKLEAEARTAKREAEWAISRAKDTARREVQSEGLHGLLNILSSVKYRVAYSFVKGPKCGHCNDTYYINVTASNGQKIQARCHCAASKTVYIVEEVFVCEVRKDRGETLVWYRSLEERTGRTDRDHFHDSKVLQNSEGVDMADLMKSPYNYGYDSKRKAQLVAHKLNQEEATK